MRRLLGWSARVCVVAVAVAHAQTAKAGVLFSNGFETDTAGWNVFGGGFDATRVPSGTNGITSASGSFHAESSASGSAGNWGAYNYGAGNAVPTVFKEYTTSADIYLNVGGGWANDTRFDFDSAINNSGGTFLRDFIFNAGFYDSSDLAAPGAGTNRFVISASNNSSPGSAYPQNPAKSPIAISTTGWYTFKHHFYDNAGVLAVDMSIYDSSSVLVNTWTLSDPSDLISGVGGNRYGWFDYNEFSTLAFDNTSLVTADVAAVPEPSTVASLGAGLLVGLGALARRRRMLASA